MEPTTKPNRADALGELRLVVYAPELISTRANEFQRWLATLAFTCATCRCGIADTPWGRPTLLGAAQVAFDRNDGVDVLTPHLVFAFDPLQFGAHLLHEVRPFWQNRCMGPPVRVMDQRLLDVSLLPQGDR